MNYIYQAAAHIHRYLTLDEKTLRKTVEDSDDLEGIVIIFNIQYNYMLIQYCIQFKNT